MSVKGFSFLVSFLVTTSTFAGVIGVGNSGDISMQLGFAKSSAISTLQSVEIKEIENQVSDPELVSIYKHCRQSMYLGAVVTEFELVEKLDDSDGFHALARRIDKKKILISRTQLEHLSESGTLTNMFLTSLVLHEVGHDCFYKGRAVDDTFDSRLDRLAQALFLVASNDTHNHERHMVFMRRSKAGERLTTVYLPQKLKSVLVMKYLDYSGDFAFNSLPHELRDRPLAASQFYESQSTNVFPSWGLVPLVRYSDIDLFRSQILEPPVLTNNFSYKTADEVKPLETQLNCDSAVEEGVDVARCRLSVFWPSSFHHLAKGIQFEFMTNLFGQVEIEKIGPLF